MSEQPAEQTQGEPGSLSAGTTSADPSGAHHGPVTASALKTSSVEIPGIAADHEAPKPDDVSGAETSKPELSQSDVPGPATGNTSRPEPIKKPETISLDPAKPAAKLEAPAKLTTIAPGARPSSNEQVRQAKTEASVGPFGKRRFAGIAAVVVLAAIAGALGGALATANLKHLVGADLMASATGTLDSSIARIEAEVSALRASVEQTSQMGAAQLNKTSDRLDKLEKAQAEPAARLAKLSEAVDKLRAAPATAAPVAANNVAAKEVTGSVAPTAVTATPPPAPKPEVARLPTVDGWVLRDVSYGAALIEGRRGTYEVYAGDAIPGLGRVDAIRRQDGHWVVVTSKGLIVAR